MTFKELFQTGQCSISAIDAWVDNRVFFMPKRRQQPCQI